MNLSLPLPKVELASTNSVCALPDTYGGTTRRQAQAETGTQKDGAGSGHGLAGGTCHQPCGEPCMGTGDILLV